MLTVVVIKQQTIVANFRSYNNTKYCKNQSTFHGAIAKIKMVVFEHSAEDGRDMIAYQCVHYSGSHNMK